MVSWTCGLFMSCEKVNSGLDSRERAARARTERPLPALNSLTKVGNTAAN